MATAPDAAAHDCAAAMPLAGATTRSLSPWMTSSGGSGCASAGRSGSRRPPIAARADAAECAAPGATPECITSARKRSGCRVASSAAMPAPADRPAMPIAAGSTGYSRQA